MLPGGGSGELGKGGHCPRLKEQPAPKPASKKRSWQILKTEFGVAESLRGRGSLDKAEVDPARPCRILGGFVILS
jgi:hypothetical protein